MTGEQARETGPAVKDHKRKEPGPRFREGWLRSFLREHLSPSWKRRLRNLQSLSVRAQVRRLEEFTRSLERRLSAVHWELGESKNEINSLDNRMLILAERVELLVHVPERLGLLESSLSEILGQLTDVRDEVVRALDEEAAAHVQSELEVSVNRVAALNSQLTAAGNQLKALESVPERLQTVEGFANDINGLTNQLLVIRGDLDALRSRLDRFGALEDLPASLKALRDEMSAALSAERTPATPGKAAAVPGEFDDAASGSGQPAKDVAALALMEVDELRELMLGIGREVESFREFPSRLQTVERIIQGLDELPAKLSSLGDEVSVALREEAASVNPIRERLRFLEQSLSEAPSSDELEKVLQDSRWLGGDLASLKTQFAELAAKVRDAESASELSVRVGDDLGRACEELRARVKTAEAESYHLKASLYRDLEERGYQLRRDLLRQRQVLVESRERVGPASDQAVASKGFPTLEECFEKLAEAAPQAFPVWKRVLDDSASSYDGFPVDSCSVQGHPMAEIFGCFLRPYWGGRVLDIGCGPQPLPIYLEGYPLDLVYGIDPLTTNNDHPFHFVSGIAEMLPWDDGQFELVVAGTSLDHVLLLDRSLQEIRRVLTPDGRFVVWVGFVPGADRYDPHAEGVEPIDDFHLFHFDRAWFEEAISPLFTVREAFHFDQPYNSSFYSLSPRIGDAQPPKGSLNANDE